MIIPIKKMREGAVLPRYMTEGAAGMDLHAGIDTALRLAPGERALVPTGIAMAIPAGFEGQVRPRSGLALRKGLSMVNTPGTIDADYRGEIGIILINHGADDVVVEPGERIAQLVIAAVQRATLTLVDDLETTGRSAGGFGHTGSGSPR